MEEENLKEKLEKVEKLLDSYEEKSLHFNVSPVSIELNLSREEMFKMNYQDIYGWCFDVSRYNLFLSKEINKHYARYNWAESNLNRYQEERANDFKGFTFQERKSEVLNSDEYAKKLFSLKEKAKLVIDRFSFISQKIEVLNKMALEIANVKRKGNAN